MNIGEILQNSSAFLAFYLENLSQVALVFFDEDAKIKDCNQGFLNILGLPGKPIGKNITEFLSFYMRALSFLREGEYTSISPQYLVQGNFQVSFAGYLLSLGNNYLMFFEKHQMTYNEILNKMSLLNNQLADLTRDLSKKNQELKMANARIQKIMDTDPLTGLLNRRSFRKILKKNMFFARRHNFPLALLMVDIDHFKKINDTFGHDVGDQVLKQLAKILPRSCRTEDIVARFGGEEFVVLLPGTNASSATAWAERVRAKIENARIRRVSWKVTASFGVTELLPSDTEQSFIQRADEALYAAKRKGRNCWVVIQEIDGARLENVTPQGVFERSVHR